MRLELVPVTLAEANAFVALRHRHHRPVPGAKFCIGVELITRVQEEPPVNVAELAGVAIVGRPVARHYDDGRTLEVNRTCTDGTRNANSILYGAAWRAAKALGYRRLITYTQVGESGTSLRGAGWRVVAERPARGSWAESSVARPRFEYGAGQVQRTLWEATA